VIAFNEEPTATRAAAFRVFNAELIAFRRAAEYVGDNGRAAHEALDRAAFETLLEMVCALSDDRAATLMRMEAFWERVAERFAK
jgi:hypothetical protein